MAMLYYGTDHDVLNIAHDWLKGGHEVLLVTVLRTWGSSPRPPGSLMIMRDDGVLHGSVSGGCVEEDLLQRYRSQQLVDNYPTLIDYGVNRSESNRLGLPCGGRLELLIERIEQLDDVQQVLDVLIRQQSVSRQVNLLTGQVCLQLVTEQQEFNYNADYVTKVFGPQWQMLLIGAGHLSQYVSRMALMLGYHVIVCDPREEYVKDWKIEGCEITSIMPDDAVLAHILHSRSIVLALTHDPKLDDMAILDALKSPAFYVGAIGSRKNCEMRRQRLQQFDISNKELDQLHAPVGIDIGSHTPPEIAVSILADITRHRNLLIARKNEMISNEYTDQRSVHLV